MNDKRRTYRLGGLSLGRFTELALQVGRSAHTDRETRQKLSTMPLDQQLEDHLRLSHQHQTLCPVKEEQRFEAIHDVTAPTLRRTAEKVWSSALLRTTALPAEHAWDTRRLQGLKVPGDSLFACFWDGTYGVIASHLSHLLVRGSHPPFRTTPCNWLFHWDDSSTVRRAQPFGLADLHAVPLVPWSCTYQHRKRAYWSLEYNEVIACLASVDCGPKLCLYAWIERRIADPPPLSVVCPPFGLFLCV